MKTTIDSNSLYQQLEIAANALFAAAKQKDEFQFVLSLHPDIKQTHDNDWHSANETFRALKEFMVYIEAITEEVDSFAKIRMALSQYAYLTQAEGFYLTLKNALRILEGENYSATPFTDSSYQPQGKQLAPLAPAVFQDVIGHAQKLEQDDLVDTLLNSFYWPLVRGYLTGDYLLGASGSRLPNTNIAPKEVVFFDYFQSYFERGVNAVLTLKRTADHFIASYKTPKQLTGKFPEESAESNCMVHYDEKEKAFTLEN